MLVKIITAAFVIIAVSFVIVQSVDIYIHREETKKEHAPLIPLIVIEALTWFLSTFGVSDGAINILAYRGLKVADTKKLPGTILVGAMIPVAVMSVGYVNSVEFSPLTMITLIIAQAIGGFVGATLVKRLNAGVIRIVMACALLATAAIIIGRTYIFHAEGGSAIGLTGIKLVLVAILFCITEGLVMMGFGNTTPNICILLALGVSPLSVYPLVMTANASGCFMGCIRFIKDGNYVRKASLIEGISGVIGVLLAIRLVTSLNSSILQILMILLMVYNAISLIREQIKYTKEKAGGEA